MIRTDPERDRVEDLVRGEIGLWDEKMHKREFHASTAISLPSI